MGSGRSLTAWRFGLAAGTGMIAPDRLINAPHRSSALSRPVRHCSTPQQRCPRPRSPPALAFLSQTMVDLYSAIYDSTDPGDLPDSDAWQLRAGICRQGCRTRVWRRSASCLAPARTACKGGRAGPGRTRGDLGRARREAAKDAPELISAMLAGGYDQAAARWIPAVDRMDDDDSDRCWAMLALGAPNVADVGAGRIQPFIRRDKSHDICAARCLSRVLPGLAGSAPTPPIAQPPLRPWARPRTSWTRMIDAAAARGQGGTVLVLTGTGFQTPQFDRFRPRTCITRRRAEAHRPGLYRADDRRRGAVADVTPGRPSVGRPLPRHDGRRSRRFAAYARGLSQRSRARGREHSALWLGVCRRPVAAGRRMGRACALDRRPALRGASPILRLSGR